MTENRILVVDDLEDNLYLMRSLLEGHGYEVTSATNGREALEVARKDPPNLIISDILMPVMDGFELCRAWKQDEHLVSIPLVFYTATYTGSADQDFALSLGAERFVVKPAEPDAFIAMVQEAIQRPGGPPTSPALSAQLPTEGQADAPDEDERTYLKQYNETLFRKLEGKMQQLERANRELELDIAARQRAEDGLRRAFSGSIAALAATVELRDPYTAGHQRRVTQLACAIAAELGWDEARIDSLRTAACLHDVGKIAVPAEILSRPGQLSESEMGLIRGHATAGADMVAMIDPDGELAEVIRQHHERLDGSGYPAGLRGDELLQAARVLAVADVVEAMVSYRLYRPALPVEEATAEIRDGAGLKYDAAVSRACLRLIEERNFQFEQ